MKGFKFCTTSLEQSPKIVDLILDKEENSDKFKDLFPDYFDDKLHFLIIHQTIITKIGNKQEFERFVSYMPKQYKPWYRCITSGRGHPPQSEMPDCSKFYDFSNLRKFVVEEPNKFLLAKILSSIKEKKG